MSAESLITPWSTPSVGVADGRRHRRRPTVEESPSGREALFIWPDQHPIDLDPRYGLAVVDGQIVPADTNLSVAVSDAREVRPRAEPDPAYAAQPARRPPLRLTMPASGRPLVEFLEVMRRLRVECEWKQSQTHRSLARYLLEESHETLEAIDSGDPEHLREELGDLLLQVYFHAVIAEESGDFTIDDVAAGIIEKMVRRNPHVFGTSRRRDDAGRGQRAWESVKAHREAARPPSPTASRPACRHCCTPTRCWTGCPRGRARRRGGSADLGERLLALVAEARADGVDPEQALRDAVRRSLEED